MTKREIFERKALLHEQAAELSIQDSLRHKEEAKRLREKAKLLEESGQ